MGKRLKRWKSWKWPIGAAGFVVLLLGVHAIKSSPEFADAQSAETNAKAAIDGTQQSDQRSGADTWMEQRESGKRTEGRPAFGRRGRGNSSGNSDRQNSQGGSFSNGDDTFGSTSRTS